MAKEITPMASPSYSQRAKEAGLPILVDREFIAELGTVTWTGVTPTQARNPQNGEMQDGFLAYLETDNGDNYQSFIGGVALTKALAELEFPFRARIVRSGRTWVFAD